jgi:ABC-2 type transport system ATP-binding protein
MKEAAITAQGLTYHYGDLVAVDQVDFEVSPGEILGFLGPNGAGKSTVVKMLTGQIRPKSGQATVLGIDVARHPKKVQSQIGICFEISNLYQDLSGIDNLTLFARLFGVRDFKPEALLERVGLGGRGKGLVSSYSKGMKQRLMVARALINQPQALFLDEPTDGLDPVSAEAIRRIILEERQRGATVFLTTHDMLEADKLSDRVAFIDKGKIAAIDTPHALKQRFGRRLLSAQVVLEDGRLETRQIPMAGSETAAAVSALFSSENVVTLHSEEATLEDIFIEITGRGLV